VIAARGSAWWARWRGHARRLKREVYALAIAYRDPLVPWYARLWVAAVVAYAFSPLDLIPDFIPVLGYLDDLLLLPLGIALALRLIPPDILAASRAEAERRMAAEKPVSREAAAAIVAIWLALAVGIGWLTWRAMGMRASG
jgi:uncharacterized membrane protein YkvA (DUF1232 family)